jgi:hypothetical protein
MAPLRRQVLIPRGHPRLAESLNSAWPPSQKRKPFAVPKGRELTLERSDML